MGKQSSYSNNCSQIELESQKYLNTKTFVVKAWRIFVDELRTA